MNKSIKTEFGLVMTVQEFKEDVQEGYITPYDGTGYLHDGENKTDICVWSDGLTWEDVFKYPYVIWYNK